MKNKKVTIEAKYLKALMLGASNDLDAYLDGSEEGLAEDLQLQLEAVKIAAEILYGEKCDTLS